MCSIRYYPTSGTRTGDILQYSVSLDKVEKVSSLCQATSTGIALKAKDSTTIYYFGGSLSLTSVHKFDSLTNSTVRLPTDLPSSVRYSGGISRTGTIFVFNGLHRKIMEFSEETETAKIIGDLPFQNDTSAVYSTTAIP
jgi:hypothetical protein